MKYVLRIQALGQFPAVPLSSDEYQSLVDSREVLINALAIEEKYEIVLSNYSALEKKCLEIACDDMIRTRGSYSDFFEIRSELNTNLVNLLTSARLYIDQLIPHFKKCIQKENCQDVIRLLVSEQYDSNSSYRFMEALRNFVQHRGLPVHQTTLGARWTSLENGLLEFKLYVGSDRMRLEEDGRFKKSVLKELEDKVDLVVAVREYVESLSSIHQSVRDKVKDAADAARVMIESMHERYMEEYGEKLLGLSAQAWSNDRLVSSVPLLLEWDDVRLDLQKRNLKLANLSRRYVTSRASRDA